MIQGVKAMGMETCVTLGMLTPAQAFTLKEAGTDFGIIMRATAIVRTNSLSVGGATFSNGVPGIGTKRFIGWGICCNRMWNWWCVYIFCYCC
jgi:biotin synthase